MNALPLLAGSLVLAPTQDTTVVRADGPAQWGTDVSLEEEWTIGALEGAPHETFGDIGPVTAGPDGTVYVADNQVAAIRRFSASGEYLGSLGREGQGPGEFRYIAGIGVSDDGLLVVVDPAQSRISRMDPQREYVDGAPFSGGYFSTWRTVIVGFDGSVYYRRPAEPPAWRIGDEVPHVWLHHDPAGALVDTIRPPHEDPAGPSFTVIGPDGPREPFVTQTLNVVSPGGYVVWGRNDTYAIQVEGADGSVLSIRRAAEPVPVSRAERTQWRAWGEHFSRGPMGERYPDVPEWKPVFRDLFVDADDRIWVHRYVKPYEHVYSEEELAERGDRPLMALREQNVFDLITLDGRFLGSVTLPPGETLRHVRGDRLWAVRRGAWGEERLVQYRIVR